MTAYTVNDGNGGANYSVTLHTAAGSITPALTTTTADDKFVSYSGVSQPPVPLTATVTGSVVNEGTVTFWVMDSTDTFAVGAILAPVAVGGSAASAMFTVPAGLLPGNYVIHASYSGGPNFLASSDVAALTVGPGALLSDVAAVSPELEHMEGFDVLFGKGSTSSVLKLKNTNPGTFEYEIELRNETGTTIHPKNVAINDRNGASATVIITIPGLPNVPGVARPAGVGADPIPAFTVKGAKSVKAKPDDKTDEMPVSVSYALAGVGATGDCLNPGVAWIAGQPADGAAVRCIKVTGFAIEKKHKAKVEVKLEFRWKNTDGWASTSQTMFRAGFAFRSLTIVELDSTFPIASLAGKSYTGTQVVGLVGAGQKVTAIGGFAFDTLGNPITGAVVKVWNSAPANCGVAPVAEFTTLSDGFYFMWKTGSTQLATDPNLPYNVKYYVGVCKADGTTFAAARYIDHKLANKEFVEEDFYNVNVGP